MPSIIDNPAISIAPELIEELNAYNADQGQVVVHGIAKTQNEAQYIRIWPTTFLFDRHSDHISKLVYFEKITGYPFWTEILPHKTHHFTLIFEGLPKSCSVFDLIELIPQSNGFYLPEVLRNERDVYYLDFS